MEGIKQLVSTTLVLILAWAIGDAMRAVGTDVFIASGVSDGVDKRAIPVLVFILSAFIAASTGTSWGTSASSPPPAAHVHKPAPAVSFCLFRVFVNFSFPLHFSPAVLSVGRARPCMLRLNLIA